MNHSDAFLLLEEAPLTPGAPEFYFWLRHARRSQEPVLVVGEGAARVALPLAEQLIQVVILEADEGRRDRGEQRSREQGAELTWLGGELESFQLERRAGMIAVPGRAFQRLLTLEAQRAALANLYQNLQVGGKLALNVGMPDVRAIAEQGGAPRLLEPVQEPESGRLIYRWATSRYDPVAQLASSHVVYEMVDESGTAIRRWHRTFDLAYHWPREMQLLLESSGFEIEALYGGWQDEPFDAGASEQLWLARKGI